MFKCKKKLIKHRFSPNSYQADPDQINVPIQIKKKNH